ncbi:hypothetical protein GCM10009630_26680 [Kribbella jejuensis]|uniref:DUF4386 family protein n=1 Tax=Kribbella jejuensis TaxID=236068 RepID=A0A542DUY9_9ACTN|nr:hypothetical protein [Kribbella jejuensis]TQJ06774.1 hypothetical protein FB475_6446 [Kribbella jejuensis]
MALRTQSAVQHSIALRVLPIAGLAYAVLTVGGDLVIGQFPDEHTPVAELSNYYATHHSQVRFGGLLMVLGGMALAVFAAVVVVQSRHRPVVAALVGVAGAMAAVEAVISGDQYSLLGATANLSNVSPDAMQAWHLIGSAGTPPGGLALLFLTLAAVDVLPRWLTIPAALIGIALLTPVGFLASLVGLLWFAIGGVLLSRKPAQALSS